MELLKRRWRGLSLRKTLVVYITVAALLALVLCGITNNLCSMGIREIHASYLDSMEKYYLTNERGERLGEGAYIGTDAIPLSPKDQRTVDILRALPTVTTPVWSALCILGAALLFYRNKLKRPLAELRLASEKIAENNLDFRVEYEAADELGQLCSSFEIMRSTLAANFSEMWRQIEDRRQLNAAFAHELRTPLTVLKGYDEMLKDSGDERTKGIADTMEKHIMRMEHYVDSMGSLRRLEDLKPQREKISMKELASVLYDSAFMECRAHGKMLFFKNHTQSKELIADRDSILQVANNLAANAVRYAESAVTCCMEETEEGLLLKVTDDGKGFSEEGLRQAMNPYFTEEKGNEKHFGIGLYLCRILCGHHGGWLKIENLFQENVPSGAQITAFFRCR